MTLHVLGTNRRASTLGALSLLLVMALLFNPCICKELAAPSTPAPGIFPEFSPPRHLYVLDCSKFPRTLRASVTTFQGIINRKEPRIYLLWGAAEQGRTDMDWLRDTIVPKGITYQNVSDPIELFRLFSDETEGYIVYDPTAIHTKNVATTMAGILNATVVHPAHIDEFDSLGMRMLGDLRDIWSADEVVEMYQWAFDKYWHNCSHRMLGHTNPELDQLRDYLTACRAFTLYLDPTVPAEAELMGYILSQDEIRINTPVLGFFTQEVPGTRIVSENGCMVVASEYVSSLTVHSANKADLPLEQRRATPKTVNLEEDKVYLSFILSDGDNIAYNIYYMRQRLWNDPARGTVPLGWTTSPLLAELAPCIPEWYYKEASPLDYFTGGAGMAFIYPSLYPNLTAFTTESARYTEYMDLEELWIVNLFDEANKTTAQRMMDEIGLNGLFESLVGPRQPTVLLGGKPYLATPIDIWIGEKSNKEKVRSLVNAIQEWSAGEERPCFIFVPALAWGLDPSILHEVASSLGSDYQVVRPDELVALAKVSLSEDLSLWFLLPVVLIILSVLIAVRALAVRGRATRT